MNTRSPIALRVVLHDARAAADHEAGGGLLGDCSRECGAGQFDRAADGERFVGVALEPLLDVKIEAGEPVVWDHGPIKPILL